MYDTNSGNSCIRGCVIFVEYKEIGIDRVILRGGISLIECAMLTNG